MAAHTGRAAAERVQGNSADDQRQLQEQLGCARDVHEDLEEEATMQDAQAASSHLPSKEGGPSCAGRPQLQPREDSV